MHNQVGQIHHLDWVLMVMICPPLRNAILINAFIVLAWIGSRFFNIRQLWPSFAALIRSSG